MVAGIAPAYARVQLCMHIESKTPRKLPKFVMNTLLPDSLMQISKIDAVVLVSM